MSKETTVNGNTANWYIVSCRPQSECLAGEEILALGQTVYVPRFRREHHNRRMRKWIKRSYPLLPGYLFVLASDHWPRVLDCAHVQGVLRDQRHGGAGLPIAISDADVQAIRTAQDAGTFDDLRAHRADLKPGDTVKVREGLFSGQAGTVDAIGDENVVMLISAMCRQVRTTVPLENLARAG